MTKKKPRPDNGMHYSVLGIQMVLMIGICVFAGLKLDKYIGTQKPWFTLAGSLAGVVIAMVYVLRKVK